jgi:hypothetical protein
MRERTVERIRVLGRIARDARACGHSRVECIGQHGRIRLDDGGREAQRGRVRRARRRRVGLCGR